MSELTEPNRTAKSAPPVKQRTGGRGPRGRERWYAYGFLSPGLIGLTVFTLFPVGMAVVMSLHEWPIFGERSFLGIDNFRHLLAEDPTFLVSVRNTFVFTALFLPLNVVLSLALAFWIANCRARQVFRVLFFIPTITPMVVSAVIWKLLYQPDGVFDHYLGSWFGVDAPNFLADPDTAMFAVVAMSVWQGIGYNLIVFSAAIDALPTSVLEAAEIDGARGLVKFLRVQLPLMSPAVFFVTTMTMITSMQVFTQTYILTKGGPGDSTVTMVQNVYENGFISRDLGVAAAGAWLLFAVILLITAVQFVGQKRWVHYEH
ncbi:carbohydrate ABC transporter permease [Streptomyces cavernicola]|uniref:Sugar ABC transporter permease n=1 Tax=Streptomyces cavernicola TaxID=3043613 RepID=A0ABT6S7Y2_9ACTN|nr:sugar ABC transporter permease [Streptomyces sp. B-S-A6]MDI3404209.1 sugar ABC transporter permease [Streptomyces sp. B-S-A6]